MGKPIKSIYSFKEQLGKVARDKVLSCRNHVEIRTFKSDWLNTHGCYDLKCLDTV